MNNRIENWKKLAKQLDKANEELHKELDNILMDDDIDNGDKIELFNEFSRQINNCNYSKWRGV